MRRLNVAELSVTSFQTSTIDTGIVNPYSQDDACVSPVCMTEGRECTTPWCKEEQNTGTVADA